MWTHGPQQAFICLEGSQRHSLCICRVKPYCFAKTEPEVPIEFHRPNRQQSDHPSYMEWKALRRHVVSFGCHQVMVDEPGCRSSQCPVASRTWLGIKRCVDRFPVLEIPANTKKVICRFVAGAIHATFAIGVKTSRLSLMQEVLSSSSGHVV
ncbi:hypothetical protein BC832DRAFT_209627 [Gaertneriomyces semiglobifer]|nr:hypothetical protein BC832DRAFT_209627 [Gaertneriomyces semiglobifer]